MASVHLSFIPPDRAGFILLRILEAPDLTTPMTLIETVTDVGTFPNYITSYSTDDAAASDNYFAIQWEDDKGVRTPVTARIKGGTQTLVGKIVERSLQRDLSLNEDVVRQEAEGAIESYYGTGTDPYEIDVASVSYAQTNGLVYLTMARAYIFEQAKAADAQSVQLGLVTMRSSSTSSRNIDGLIELANASLGIGTSLILQMEDICRRSDWQLVLEP